MGEGELQITIKMTSQVIDAIANRVIELNENKKERKENYSQISYSVKEVSKITGRSEQTIGKHIRAGLLKASKVGKPYLITHINLNKYINGK